ncbi:unnamed protein product [Allacma fusca]|uniref:Uncharacterized protein n=1 Tax=Allacma fusca TaxID=39272 RepID=A0A8J2J6G5_9HEXA|nr:unnamed protein product [Allacma fusca]
MEQLPPPYVNHPIIMSGEGFQILGTPEPTSFPAVSSNNSKLPQELVDAFFPTENNSHLLEELNPSARTLYDIGDQSLEDNSMYYEWPCPQIVNSMGTSDSNLGLEIANALFSARGNDQEVRVLQELNLTSSDFNTHYLDLQSTVSQNHSRGNVYNLEDSRAASNNDTINDQRGLAMVTSNNIQKRDRRSKSSEKKNRVRKDDKKEEVRSLKEEIRCLREKQRSCVCGLAPSDAALLKI